jgi:hypothetical protein
MKEMHELQIVLQDTAVVRKDTSLISAGQDSQKEIIDTAVIFISRDIKSIENYTDTGYSPYSELKKSLTGDSLPDGLRVIQNPHRPVLIYHNILPEEEIPYLSVTDTDSLRNYNQLSKFKDHYYTVRDSSGLVYKQEQITGDSKTIQQSQERPAQTNALHYDMSPDWLMGIIIVCLIILAWLKLFFHKFINQTVASLWNFQLSKKESRDQNVFSRRVAFILNLNFIIIGGLFIYLVFSHFRINPFQLKPFFLYLFSTGFVTILLLIRQILLLLTGFIFNQQETFREYLHQILLIYKNIGIIFIPLIICIAYIHDDLRIYLIIIGIALFILAYLFRFIKGIQIIIKKDVLLFYLILYLCTLEILPVVIYCKFFSSWL